MFTFIMPDPNCYSVMLYVLGTWRSFERSSVQIFFNTSVQGIVHTLAFTGISLTRNAGVQLKDVMEGLIIVQIYTVRSTMRQLVSALMEMSKFVWYIKNVHASAVFFVRSQVGVLTVTGQLADPPTRGLGISQTGRVTEGTLHRLNNSQSGQLAN